MKDVLAPESREVLERFARSNVLLALDYDGTLAPIVEDPDRAHMRPPTRELLARAAARYPTIVISGRARDDVGGRLGDALVRAVIGNHGMEPWCGPPGVVETVARWRTALEARLAAHEGVWVEDKTYSLAVHYRQARAKPEAHAAVREAVARLGDVRVVGGKDVVNVLPPDAPHKGTALEHELERLGCDTAIYVGDDDTDEDVFTLGRPDRLLTIRVGERPTSAARYSIEGQAAIDELLRALVELRNA